MGERHDHTDGDRRRWPWMVGGVVVALGVIVVSVLVRFRDTETPVTVEAAVEDFQRAGVDAPTTGPEQAAGPTPASEPTVGAASSELPPAGVYVYATTGSEEVDALTGARHDYPTETTMTVEPEGCGVTIRWQPLRERFEELTLCTVDGRQELTGYTAFHRFFGTDDLQEFACEPGLDLAPTQGVDSSATCRSEDLIEHITAVVEPGRTTVIAGDVVPVALVRIRIELEGASTGSTEAELMLTDSGLIAGWSEAVHSVSGSPIGEVTYQETFTLTLSDLDPIT